MWRKIGILFGNYKYFNLRKTFSLVGRIEIICPHESTQESDTLGSTHFVLAMTRTWKMVGTRSKIAFWPSRVGLELIFELLGKLSGDNVGGLRGVNIEKIYTNGP